MTDNKTEALKLALGYMDGTLMTEHLTGYERKRHVMQSIREALAEQPAQQQEPVLWQILNGVCHAGVRSTENLAKEAAAGMQKTHDLGGSLAAFHVRPLYTSPPASKPRVPLTDEGIKTRTDEQIEATFKRCGGRWNGDHWVIEDADLYPFVRTIEGADLNTLRAISDEYNAWIKHHAAGHTYDDFLAKREAAHGITGETQ